MDGATVYSTSLDPGQVDDAFSIFTLYVDAHISELFYPLLYPCPRYIGGNDRIFSAAQHIRTIRIFTPGLLIRDMIVI